MEKVLSNQKDKYYELVSLVKLTELTSSGNIIESALPTDFSITKNADL